VSGASDRRTNVRLRRRIDELLRRVRGANDEIVERGLAAREHAHEVRREEEAASAPPAGAPNGQGRENGPAARPGATDAPR
jgi:ribosomal protein L14E/L6E/L27E